MVPSPTCSECLVPALHRLNDRFDDIGIVDGTAGGGPHPPLFVALGLQRDDLLGIAENDNVWATYTESITFRFHGWHAQTSLIAAQKEL